MCQTTVPRPLISAQSFLVHVVFFGSARRSFDTDLGSNERRKKLLREIKARETRQLSINELARRPSLFCSAGAKFLGRHFSQYNIPEIANTYDLLE